MSYELLFHPDALTEWGKLDKSVREQFKNKLAERLQNPHVPSVRLAGRSHRYKIKLRSSGYRLVYDVVDSRLMVTVVAVGKREPVRSTKWRQPDKRANSRRITEKYPAGFPFRSPGCKVPHPEYRK